MLFLPSSKEIHFGCTEKLKLKLKLNVHVLLIFCPISTLYAIELLNFSFFLSSFNWRLSIPNLIGSINRSIALNNHHFCCSCLVAQHRVQSNGGEFIRLDVFRWIWIPINRRFQRNYATNTYIQRAMDTKRPTVRPTENCYQRTVITHVVRFLYTFSILTGIYCASYFEINTFWGHQYIYIYFGVCMFRQDRSCRWQCWAFDSSYFDRCYGFMCACMRQRHVLLSAMNIYNNSYMKWVHRCRCRCCCCCNDV